MTSFEHVAISVKKLTDILYAMGHTLESHKLFPIVAWSLVVGFAVFTYTLTMQVQAELDGISDGVVRLEQKLNEISATSTRQ